MRNLAPHQVRARNACRSVTKITVRRRAGGYPEASDGSESKTVRLLLVCSDARLAVGIRQWMDMNGATTHWVALAREATSALHSAKHNCIVIDSPLPDMPADDLLHHIRQGGCSLPVLVVAESSNQHECIRMLDLGADDYLIKPLQLDTLAARLRAALRRWKAGSKPQESEIHHGRVRLRLTDMTVWQGTADVPVTRTEFSLLRALLTHCGEVVSRESLEQACGVHGHETSGQALEVHIHHLRRKLGADLIRTVRGLGYRIDRLPAPSPMLLGSHHQQAAHQELERRLLQDRQGPFTRPNEAQAPAAAESPRPHGWK